MKKKFRTALTSILCSLCLIACKNNDGTMEFPDPKKYFEDCEFNTISIHTNDISLDGFEILSNKDNLKEAYQAYIKVCEENEIWVDKVFVSDNSWCYQNEDGSKWFAVNYSEDKNSVTITVKDVEKEKETSNEK